MSKFAGKISNNLNCNQDSIQPEQKDLLQAVQLVQNSSKRTTYFRVGFQLESLHLQSIPMWYSSQQGHELS